MIWIDLKNINIIANWIRRNMWHPTVLLKYSLEWPIQLAPNSITFNHQQPDASYTNSWKFLLWFGYPFNTCLSNINGVVNEVYYTNKEIIY